LQFWKTPLTFRANASLDVALPDSAWKDHTLTDLEARIVDANLAWFNKTFTIHCWEEAPEDFDLNADAAQAPSSSQQPPVASSPPSGVAGQSEKQATIDEKIINLKPEELDKFYTDVYLKHGFKEIREYTEHHYKTASGLPQNAPESKENKSEWMFAIEHVTLLIYKQLDNNEKV
jgi:hypothetical protein